jgi:hypothetical protein
VVRSLDDVGEIEDLTPHRRAALPQARTHV